MPGSVAYEYGTGPVRAAPMQAEYHPAAFAHTRPPSTAAYSSAPSAPSTTAASVNQAHHHQQLQLYRGNSTPHPHYVQEQRLTPYVAPTAPAMYREDDGYYRGGKQQTRRWSEGRRDARGGRGRKNAGAKKRVKEEHRPTLGDTMVMIIKVVVDAIKTPSGRR
ncbi:hypothetical protein BKA81DRAFT_402482 [Phyllosticta paracitricarpa]